METSSILIVEDEFVIAKDIQISLENMGYIVCAIVSSGEEAITKAKKEKPDLVLMDIILKGEIDGIEAARQIRSLFKIPIVYLTAYADENTLEKAKITEPYGYILKPFKNRDLNIAIEIALYKNKMEKKLIQSEERFKFLAENMADIVWTLDLNFQTTYVSPSIEKVLGFTPAERKQQTLEEMVTPESFKRISETFLHELELEKMNADPDRVITMETEYYHKTGTIVWIESNIKGMREPDGKLIGIYGSSRDITARKRAETALVESEKKYRLLADNTADVIYTVNLETEKITYASPSIKKMLGYTAEDCLSLSTKDVVTTESYTIQQQKLLETLINKKQEPEYMELEAMHKDGHIVPVEIHASIVFDKQGNPVEILGVSRDITERKLAEKVLQESEQRFRTVSDFAYDWECWVGPDGNYIHVSPSCKRITGYGPDDFMNNPGLMMEIIHLDDRAIFTKHRHVVNQSGEVDPIDFRIITKNGDERWIAHTCQAVYDTDGQHLGQRGSNRDITEQKKLQEQVMKARKLESLGVLAGGIAHDLNNLLYVVMGNISLAQDDLKPEIGTSESLKEAEQACIKAKELSARLITFSKGGDPVKKITSMGDLLKAIVASALSGSDIKPEISIADDIRQVNIDEKQIRQVVSNIVVNAREAMEYKGQLKVSCENIEISEQGYLTLSPGEYIKTSFTDQGCGISKENLEKIFDPYFSTKDMGADKGQGLGLTISYSIIKKHGGLINVESKLETGSTCSVYLPALSVKEPDLQK